MVIKLYLPYVILPSTPETTTRYQTSNPSVEFGLPAYYLHLGWELDEVMVID
jgi:hypothetical protein